MITLDNQNIDCYKKYCENLINFLKNYTWITDAYVSDFFFKHHWDKLPNSWQSALPSISTAELSFLLDRDHPPLRNVVPLSLLSFKKCCDTYSLDRRCCNDVDGQMKSLFSKHKYTDHACDGIEDKQTVIPLESDGRLHAYFRKHVKPKKQHEIKQLAKVISLEAGHIGCGNVVDVGSGLGHLVRVLSFGYGLNVTTVEAANSHAPKAQKYDREIDREIKKKKLKQSSESDSLVSDVISMPSHVTSMIYPNMSTKDFISIVNSQKTVENQQLTAERSQLTVEHPKLTVENPQLTAEHPQLTAERPQLTAERSQLTAEYSKLIAENQQLKAKNSQLTLELSQTTVGHLSSLHETCDNSKQSTSTDKTVENPHFTAEHSTTVHEICDDLKQSTSTDKTVENPQLTADHSTTVHKKFEISKPSTSTETDNDSSHMTTSDWNFVLTGLHACGDLTPTLIRFYTNCEACTGLASVGCCYMKMSDSSSNNEMVGYPMSEFISSIPGHNQSYAARELACHFAETYSIRLKEGPPHLKIHSYRAALEWLANRLSPSFQRTAVQIPCGKSFNMQFERYARLGLSKLGIPETDLSEQLLHEASKLTDRWQDVVAFYTIRLALAPVVETLILLDRMIYLYEKEHTSHLLPVFEPELSPRNFVLLSWKNDAK